MDVAHPRQFAAGFDPTPEPRAPPGYTLTFTFHRAVDLAATGGNTSSSSFDPYLVATIHSNVEKRHPDDPDLQFRTPTVYGSVSPHWNAQWTLGHMPTVGFTIECSILDENETGRDGVIGRTEISVDDLGPNWTGFTERSFEIKPRKASKRASFLRTMNKFASNVKPRGAVVVSIANLGKTPGGNGGKIFTKGPLHWSGHASVMIGRLAGTQATSSESGMEYDFQASKIQLEGPVPAPLYHHYVESNRFFAGTFRSTTVRGKIFNHLLHHQHERVYCHDRRTVYGICPGQADLTKKFLELALHGEGSRLFAYVLTLDAQLRFTQTGPEFGIDRLTKHALHSDLATHVAICGEFFIRNRNIGDSKPSRSYDASSSTTLSPSRDLTPLVQAPPATEGGHAPSNFELVIDNDSGTYQPTGQYLHLFKKFLESNLPGLEITVLDYNTNREELEQMKSALRKSRKSDHNA